MPLRLFTLTFAILLALIGIGAGIWAARQTPPFHTSGLHGIGFLFILPAPFLAALGVWVRLALGLAALVHLSAPDRGTQSRRGVNGT